MAAAVKWLLRTFVIPAWAREALPTLDGEYVGVSGLSAAGVIQRDEYGVPHIEARNTLDAVALVGFCHAQDRLWQMEQTRRLGHGRLSEILGSDAVPVDVFARKMGWKQLAEEDLEREQEAEANDGSIGHAILKAYCAGVNAGIESLDALPWEFRLLKITRVEPWTEVDTLIIHRVMAFNLSYGWQGPVLHTWLTRELAKAPQEAIHEWIQPICSPYSTDPVANRTTVPPGPPPGGGDGDEQPPVSFYAKTLEKLWDPCEPAARVAQGVGLNPGMPECTGNGSNFYAVHGRYTKSGGALMATDPHLAITMPGFFYQAHIRGTEDSLHVGGATFPGIPLVLNGHNDFICWGQTLTFAQVEDVFLERIVRVQPGKGGGEVYYEHKGVECLAEHRVESISVKGQSQPTLVDVYTTVHGVVITDLTSGVGEGGKDGGTLPKHLFGMSAVAKGVVDAACSLAGGGAGGGISYALAFASSTRQPRMAPLMLLHQVNTCQTFEHFAKTFRQAEWMSMNWGYGDSKGNVGYVMSGVVPVRQGPRGREMSVLCGWSGEDDYSGIVPVDEMPCVLNPVQHAGKVYVISANSQMVDYRTYPHYLGQIFLPGFRYKCIEDALQLLLGTQEGPLQLTSQGFGKAMHSFRDTLGEEYRDLLRELGQPHVPGAPLSPAAAEAYRLFVQWDGYMEEDSAGAAVSGAFRLVLKKNILDRGLIAAGAGDVGPGPRLAMQGYGFLNVLRQYTYLKV